MKKALILAAGFGKRLEPFSKNLPKVLFPIAKERPIIDIIINQLIKAGFESIAINTHHLSSKIETFIKKQKYRVPVHIYYEKKPLETAGGIKNLADFWNDEPFLVINGDILTNIDLKKLYEFHKKNNKIATLALHNHNKFNKISVKNGIIKSFDYNDKAKELFAFMGIHILEPKILDFIPEDKFIGIIDIYKALIKKNIEINSLTFKNHYWQDIGNIQDYEETVLDNIGQKFFSLKKLEKLEKQELQGDGSDRRWYRLYDKKKSCIASMHSIATSKKTLEVDSFFDIGNHLFNKNLPYPKIYSKDRFSGIVLLQDLGDIKLQSYIKTTTQDETIKIYKQIIDWMIEGFYKGIEEFDLKWCFKNSEYNKKVIIEDECKYFTESFLNNYLKKNISFYSLKKEFNYIAKKALNFSVLGFMHRDMQSRNIMVIKKDKNIKFYFIDFQGGMKGLIQYDLASLLIDPYVNLSKNTQNTLSDYCTNKFIKLFKIEEKEFKECYKYCTITRNLQMLGAFSFLSKVKKKIYFEEYIPIALKTLKENCSELKNEVPLLFDTIDKIKI